MLTRRQFTNATLASLILSPFAARRAKAQATKRAKRVLFFCSMGTNPTFWTPRAPPNDVFNVMTDPLSAIKQDVVLVEGLASSDPGENHGSPEGLTGKGFPDPNPTSVDQFIAQKIAMQDSIPALLLGTNTNAN